MTTVLNYELMKDFPRDEIISRPCGFSSQKFSVLLMSQASSLIMGHFHSSSPWDVISYRNNGGQDTDIFSSGVLCKNSGNWNGGVLVRSTILSAALWIFSSGTWRISLLVLSSCTWAAGSDSILSGIPDSCCKFTIILGFWQFPTQTFPLPIWFQNSLLMGNILLLVTLLKITSHCAEICFL